MIRLWFKDMTYMDIHPDDLHFWEMDPNLSHVEYTLLIQGHMENGHYVYDAHSQ